MNSQRSAAVLAALLALAPAVARAQGGQGSQATQEEGAAALPCSSADTSNTFPDAPTRNQCSIGCCHSFAAVALVESAIFRKHKVPVRLSEADLFVQTKLLPALKKNVARALLQLEKLIEGGCVSPDESGNPKDDIQFILEHGVALADTAPFGPFAREYQDSKSRGDLARFDPELALVGDLRYPGSRSASSSLGGLAREGMNGKGVDSTGRGGKQPRPEKSSGSLTREQKLAPLRQDRENVRALLAGFKLEEVFPREEALRQAHTVKELDACLGSSAGQKAWLAARLCAGAPAGVSMDLDGLPEWGGGAGAHAFVISGFEARNGGLVFQTRNSWGGKNPEVLESQLCRIYKGVSLSTPEEAQQAAAASLKGLGSIIGGH